MRKSIPTFAKVRWISIILSILIFSLSIIPCSDSHTCGMEEHEVLGHNHSEDTEDHCSPFCVCHCCGISIGLPEEVEDLSFHEKKSIKYTFAYFFDYLFDHSSNTWRPPNQA